jgi:hypothetical protein
MAVGRRACPSRQSRRRSTSWSSSASDCMSSTQAPSRLKQIDGRSCTGNVSLLKLGGRPARPLRNFATTFLGCQLKTNPEKATRDFVLAAEEFINQDVASDERRAVYQVALLAKMQDETLDLRPRDLRTRTCAGAIGHGFLSVSPPMALTPIRPLRRTRHLQGSTGSRWYSSTG